MNGKFGLRFLAFLGCLFLLPVGTVGQVIRIKRSVAIAFDRPQVEEMLNGASLQKLVFNHYENERSGGVSVCSPVRITPDGQFAVFVTGSPGGYVKWQLRVWSLATGAEVRRMVLGAKRGRDVRLAVDEPWYLGLSPDGTLAVTTNRNIDVPLQVWQLDRGEEIHRVSRQVHEYGDQGFTFSADGSVLVVERIAPKHHLDCYDTKTWKPTKTFAAPPEFTDKNGFMVDFVGGYGCMTFSREGDRILATSILNQNPYVSSDYLIAWKTATGQPDCFSIENLLGKGMVLQAFAQANDGRWVTVHSHKHANYGDDSVVTIWEKLFERKVREWILPIRRMKPNHVAFSPDGKQLVVTETTASSTGLYGIILDTLTGDVVGLTGIGHATLLPDGKHVIGVADGAAEIWSLETQLPVARFVPLSEPRHWATLAIGSAFSTDPETIKLIRAQEEYTWKYDLKATDQEFETVEKWLDACHRPEKVQTLLTSISKCPGDQPAAQSTLASDENGITKHLFFLGMGIAKHKYEEYDLAYCDRDVKAVAEAFKKQQGRLFGKVHLQTYVNEQATRENLEAGLRWIAEGCKPEDTAIVMFTGHALRGRRGLYYLPYDGDFESLAATCLNWDQVGLALKQCRSKKILFLSDACHAGAFGKGKLPLQADLVDSLVKAAGVMVLASSDDSEESFELRDLRHGAFTAALLDGLSGKSDANNDGRITLGELADYAINAVPRMTARIQHPCIPDVGSFDRDLVITLLKPPPTKAKQILETPSPANRPSARSGSLAPTK